MILNKILKSDILKNIFGVGVFRIFGVVTNFILIGLIYRYFSNDELNGIWLTVSSILTWLSIFDFGMGNSLRNKLTESISKKEILLSKQYISTAYVVMIIPTVAMICIFASVSFLIDWIDLFNIKNPMISNHYLTLFICFVVILFSINFYLSIINAILHATFQSYKISIIQFLINIINIILVVILIFFRINDLITLGVTYIGTSVIVLFLATYLIFKYLKFDLRPSFKFYNKSLIKDIFSIGMKFLFLQLAIIVLFNTDNLIISKYIGIDEVTSYQLLYKLLSIFSIILSIILTPIWTAIIKYNTINEVGEIRKTFSRLLTLFAILSFGVIILGFFSPLIINLWVGTKLFLDYKLILFMCIFTILQMWCNIFQSVLNGLNLLNVQTLLYGIATIVNIPISIYLVENTNLGLAGIILGTIFSLVFPGVVLPIYLFRYFNGIKNQKALINI